MSPPDAMSERGASSLIAAVVGASNAAPPETPLRDFFAGYEGEKIKVSITIDTYPEEPARSIWSDTVLFPNMLGDGDVARLVQAIRHHVGRDAA